MMPKSKLNSLLQGSTRVPILRQQLSFALGCCAWNGRWFFFVHYCGWRLAVCESSLARRYNVFWIFSFSCFEKSFGLCEKWSAVYIPYTSSACLTYTKGRGVKIFSMEHPVPIWGIKKNQWLDPLDNHVCMLSLTRRSETMGFSTAFQFFILPRLLWYLLILIIIRRK